MYSHTPVYFKPGCSGRVHFTDQSNSDYLDVCNLLVGLVTQQSYEGEWLNGEKQGKGTYRYRRSDGTVYEVSLSMTPTG